jgi:hypothetical protein
MLKPPEKAAKANAFDAIDPSPSKAARIAATTF